METYFLEENANDNYIFVMEFILIFKIFNDGLVINNKFLQVFFKNIFRFFQ